MDFTFTEDQLLFQEEIKKFLVNEITPEMLTGDVDEQADRNVMSGILMRGD